MILTLEQMLARIGGYNELPCALSDNDFGFSLMQWAVLIRLSHAEKLRTTDLATYLHVEVATITMMSRELFQQTLIVHVSGSSDRREKYIAITPAGRSALSRLTRLELGAAT
jgi:DNA-binding MarR family transcriptional regulator